MVSKRAKPKSPKLAKKEKKKVIGFVNICAMVESIIMGNGRS